MKRQLKDGQVDTESCDGIEAVAQAEAQSNVFSRRLYVCNMTSFTVIVIRVITLFWFSKPVSYLELSGVTIRISSPSENLEFFDFPFLGKFVLGFREILIHFDN